MKPGIYYDLSNEAYHAGPGVCKSQLDDIALNPAVYLWRNILKKFNPLKKREKQLLTDGKMLMNNCSGRILMRFFYA